MYDENSKSYLKDKPKVNDSMYKYCKRAVGQVADWDKISEPQRKHYTAYRDFVEMWESGAVSRWQDFFYTTEEIYEKAKA